jgi:hypothetical protein
VEGQEEVVDHQAVVDHQVVEDRQEAEAVEAHQRHP